MAKVTNEQILEQIECLARQVSYLQDMLGDQPSRNSIMSRFEEALKGQEILLKCLQDSKLFDLIQYCQKNVERVNQMTLELKGVIAQSRALFQEGKAFQRINDLPMVSETLNDVLSNVRKELPRLYHKIDKMGRLMKEFDECLDLLPNPCEQAYPDNQALAQASDALRAAQKSPEKPRAK